MDTSELRLNKATRQWVILAPARRKRPRDFRADERERPEIPAYEADCPFCPGNDRFLTEILSEDAGPDGSWRTRVAANKFPALTPGGETRRIPRGDFLTMRGYGHHEVIIETPAHDRQPGRMTAGEVERIVEAYHRRYADLMKFEKNLMIILFRNHGKSAGTSLLHPHSQVISTGVVPHHVRWREEEARRYFDEWGRCVYCDILAQERSEGGRMIFENSSFAAFVPFAADVPFETWIVPHRHRADFGEISDVEKADLAGALQDILGRFQAKLSDPDYNYVVNTSTRHRAGELPLHWYVRIRPRLVTPAGFEMGSGMSINPSIPEEDAAFLRDGAPYESPDPER